MVKKKLAIAIILMANIKAQKQYPFGWFFDFFLKSTESITWEFLRNIKQVIKNK